MDERTKRQTGGMSVRRSRPEALNYDDALASTPSSLTLTIIVFVGAQLRCSQVHATSIDMSQTGHQRTSSRSDKLSAHFSRSVASVRNYTGQ
jgi:hypothetical protein